MFKKSINNSTNSIVGQLRVIVAVLSVFAAFNLLTIYRQTDGMIGDSRVVNFTGIVRGKTQRLVKLGLLQGESNRAALRERETPQESGAEINPAESELQPEAELILGSGEGREIQEKIDAFIPELDQLITGLINGDKELELPRLRDQAFQADMEQLRQAWETLKVDLVDFLENPSPERETRLLAASEAYWDITNQATFSAEAYAAKDIRNSKIIAVTANLSILVIVLVISEKLRIKLKNTVSSLTSSSTQIATTIAQQERIASQQATSVNETTATMDELEASSRHAAEQAKAAVEDAKKAFTASEAGAQAVGEGLQGMFDLEKKVDAIAEQIVSLSGQASQIGDISQLVIDFANQTNMLALNSSVEAVRAGEHGKGFAVVANEIRKLADQSQQSADKINTLVSEIQKAVNQTVMVAEEGTKTVKTGVKIARRTEVAFSQVKDAVNQVVLNNQQVSLNLKQQFDAIQQVVDAMNVINQGAKETASGLGQTKAGTEYLNEAALGLQKIV